jgi:iron-sulfur cluster repair protein YtfE (RIC family)
MVSLTQPLHDEHRELLLHVEEIRRLADTIGEAPIHDFWRDADGVYDFLTRQLGPHAIAEDQALYPVVGKVMGTRQATATMSREHLAIACLISEFSAIRADLSGQSLTRAQMKVLRRVLYGLYTLLKVHFLKEEEVYLPLLDVVLTPDEAHNLFEVVETAARHARYDLDHGNIEARSSAPRRRSIPA